VVFFMISKSNFTVCNYTYILGIQSMNYTHHNRIIHTKRSIFDIP